MKLLERDRKIMMMRYGLFGEKELTQKDVALKLGISQSYISRIEKKVIRKLKNSVKCWQALLFFVNFRQISKNAFPMVHSVINC